MRSIIPVIEQRLSALESQMAVNASRTDSMLKKISEKLDDISAGRAPLNINISIISSDQYQIPTVTASSPNNTLTSTPAATATTANAIPSSSFPVQSANTTATLIELETSKQFLIYGMNDTMV